MVKHEKWSNEEHERLIELKEKGYSYQEIANMLTVQFNQEFTFDAVRNRLRRTNEKKEDIPHNYKETVEILHDGSHKSDKLLRMSSEQAKDVNYLLKAHGFDKDSWELVTAKNNIWNVYSKEDKVQTLYSSKITVKPKTNNFSLEQLTEVIKQIPSITYKVEHTPLEDKRLLEIPIYDPHFPISDLEHYRPTLGDIQSLLLSKRWEEVLFVVGQDLFHNDNFKGTTANGTVIDKVDMSKAWMDAYKFYSFLIEIAIWQSNHVKIIYSKGNHDESMSWAFVQVLKERFPQVSVDDEIKERKAHTYGNIFIGITHGDKARKRLENLFPVEFPLEWAKAKTREVHIGHIHTEDAKDVYGMMIRTLATRNKTDQWHKDNGFVGAHKRFMLFEYNEDELKHIHYV